MLILTSLLSCLLVISVPRFSTHTSTSVHRESEISKTIYVDASLHEQLINPYVHYNNGEYHDVALSFLENDIYRVDIQTNTFSDTSYGFDIRDENGFQSS